MSSLEFMPPQAELSAMAGGGHQRDFARTPWSELETTTRLSSRLELSRRRGLPSNDRWDLCQLDAKFLRRAACWDAGGSSFDAERR